MSKEIVFENNNFKDKLIFNINGQDCEIDYSKFCFDIIEDNISGTSAKDLYGRLDYAKTLCESFFDENYKKKIVSIVAMGGLGKTAFAHIYKKNYGDKYANIYHTYINNSLYDNFVEKMKSLISNVGFDNAIETYKSNEEKKKKIIQVLNGIPTGPNLLVLDINIRKGFSTDFFNDVFFSLNDKWHVLVLSRRMFEGLEPYRFSRKFYSLSDEPEEAVKMFRAISGVPDTVCDDKDLKDIFAIPTFDYHPLLIETLAAYCKNHKNEVWNPDAIRHAIGESQNNETISSEMKHRSDGECDDEEELKYVYQYMRRLISFEDYSPNCQTILRHFILWPYDYIADDVVKTFLSGYGIKSLDGDLDGLVNNMVLDPTENMYRVYGFPLEYVLRKNNLNVEINDVVINQLKQNTNLPIVLSKGFRMHEILKYTLSDKALEEKKQFHYQPYLEVVSELLKIRRSFSDFLPYHECIAKTIEYNGKLFICDEISILIAGHYWYIEDSDYRSLVRQSASDIIRKGFCFDNEDSAEKLDRLAVAMHDFSLALVILGDDEVAELAFRKSIEIRNAISNKNIDDAAKRINTWRLALEYYCLCILSEKQSKNVCINEFVRMGLKLLTDDHDADHYLLKFMLLRFGSNSKKLYDATKNYINSSKCRLSDKYSPIPVMVDIGNGMQIGKYPITQFQWDWVMGDSKPSVMLCDIRRGVGPDYPMYMVTWFDAIKYCNALSVMQGLEEVYSYEYDDNHNVVNAIPDKSKHGYRLPFEKEWQDAASCYGKYKQYSGTDDLEQLKDYAWYEDNSGATTHSVGGRKPNELGIYDMSGNVWEWCQDFYDSSGASRVLRGGSWNSSADYCRVSYRSGHAPGNRFINDGFRLLLSSPKKEKI